MILNGFDKALKKQSAFEQAKVAFNINAKVVETAYNYYKVKPEKIMDKMGIVIFSLVFYVVYTMWYGFAILFVFEGWGLKIAYHSSRSTCSIWHGARSPGPRFHLCA